MCLVVVEYLWSLKLVLDVLVIDTSKSAEFCTQLYEVCKVWGGVASMSKIAASYTVMSNVLFLNTHMQCLYIQCKKKRKF